MFTGADIRSKRKQLGLTVEELADLLKVSKDNLYKWEKGTRPTRPEDFLAIENWLNGLVEIVPRGNRNNSSGTLQEPLEAYGAPLDRTDEYIHFLKDQLKEARQELKESQSSGILGRLIEIESMLSGFLVELKKTLVQQQHQIDTMSQNFRTLVQGAAGSDQESGKLLYKKQGTGARKGTPGKE